MLTDTGYEDIGSLHLRERRAAQEAANNWNDYVLEHKNNSLEIVDVFEIDLNTLISLDVKLEMMYHTTVKTD